MEWLVQLQGQIVGLDTAPYLLEYVLLLKREKLSGGLYI